MISDYLYNTKLKIYPDQTIVATFANRPKFRTASDDTDCSNKPGKALMSWRYEVMLKSNITYDNGYIYTDFETGELIYISHLMPADTLCLTDRPNFPKRSDNVKRAKDKIYDIVALNEWSYFFTGTLGSTKFDPTNAKEALKPVQKWLKNMVTRYGLKYVLVAEYQPKSGRIHWHGFINDALQVVDSGTRLVPWAKKPKKISTIIKNGYDPALYDDRVVYNLPQWRFGWSTAIKAYNGSQACARYITKYVTKEDKAIFGRYYWSSKNIRREPDICLTDFDYDSVFTQDGLEIQQEVAKRLIERNISISCCESPTAGKFASMLADVPGISEVFSGGYIIYDENAAKELMAIPDELLEDHTLYSSEAADAMARKLHEKTGCRMCAAITGVAGPDPVGDITPGMYNISVLFDGKLYSRKYNRRGRTRELNREFMAQSAFDMILRIIDGKKMTEVR